MHERFCFSQHVDVRVGIVSLFNGKAFAFWIRSTNKRENVIEINTVWNHHDVFEGKFTSAISLGNADLPMQDVNL